MKWLRYIMVVAVIPCLVACEEEGNDSKIKELTVELNKSKILDDGEDAVYILAKDQDDRNVNTEVEFYADQQLLSENKFTSTTPGTVQIHAEYKDVTSTNVEVTVVEDSGLKFRKNVLIEQFTGTWCQYCPRAIYQAGYLMTTDTAVTHVAYHLGDVFSYTYNEDLYAFFGFQYVPVMVADRKNEWTGSVSEVNAMHQPQRVGLSMSVDGTCNALDVTVQVKFGKIFDDPLNLTVYVVHDSLVADQSNYYNDDPSSVWYQMGDPMLDFVHENTMVKTATNLFGDPIPADSVDIAGTYTKTFNISGFTCNNIDQIEVVAFVSYAEGTNFFVVANSMACAYGEEKDYELVIK